MDYATLVVPELTAGKLQTGEALIRTLDSADIPVSDAFWLWSGDYADWRLVLASPIVDTRGAHGFYEETVSYVTALNSFEVSIMNVVAASPTDPTVAGLHDRVGPRPGINSIRLTGNVIGGVLIPGVHIYRLT